MFSMSVWKISTWQHLMSQKSEMKNSLWMTECLHVACFWSMTRNMLTPCRHNLEWYEVRITMHSSLFRVKRKSIPSHCHWVIIPAFCAALPILLSMMPLQSLPLQWELERERERERSLGWTSPGLIQIEWEGFPLYWLGRLWWQSNSVFFGSSGSLPVISAEGQRVCWRLPSPSFTQPRCGRWQDLSSLK